MHQRRAGTRGTCEQHSRIVESPIGEFTEMAPGAELQCSRETGIVLALVASELRLGDKQRRIAQPEIHTVAIARIRISRTRSGRIAVERGEEQRCVLAKVQLQPHARRCKRIGRTAARQVDGCNRRPVALQENRAQVAKKEFAVRGELAETKCSGTVKEFSLQPELRETRGGCRFDRGDRIQSADIVAANTTGVINQKVVRVERPVFPARQLFKIECNLRFQLALVDGAAPYAAREVAQNVIRVDEIERNATVVEALADAPWVAIGGQTRRNRWLRDPVFIRPT